MKDFFKLLNPVELVQDNKDKSYYYFCKHDLKVHYKYGMCIDCYMDWRSEIKLRNN